MAAATGGDCGSPGAGGKGGGAGSPVRRKLEQGVHKLLVIHVAQGLAARVERAILGKGDHVIGGLADLLGAGKGGLNFAVTDELGCECTQQRLALVGRLVELTEPLAVALQGNG